MGDFAERLRRQSRKLTGPRLAILRVLRERRQPLSSKEVWSALPPGESDLATIYRSLHLLEDLEMVRRFDLGDGVARYVLLDEPDDGHHHHLICRQCAEVIELDECFVEQAERQIARQSGYTGLTHRLEFFGLCPKCQPV